MPGKKSQAARASRSISRRRLNEMIGEAIVDCYNESEQVGGLFTMLEDNLAVPFVTSLLGMEITVERLDLNDAEEVVAVCKRGSERQRVPIFDLPLPTPKPAGADWIEAYRQWAKGRS